MTLTLERRPQPDDTAAGYHQSWFPLALARDVKPGRVARPGLPRHPRDPLPGRDRPGGGAGRLLPPPGRGSLGGPGGGGADPLRLPPLDVRLRRHVRGHPGRRQDPAGRPHPDLPERGGVGARLGVQRRSARPSRCRAFPAREERELVYETHFRGTRATDPWVATSNGVDFQHLRTLHGLPGGRPGRGDASGSIASSTGSNRPRSCSTAASPASTPSRSS